MLRNGDELSSVFKTEYFKSNDPAKKTLQSDGEGRGRPWLPFIKVVWQKSALLTRDKDTTEVESEDIEVEKESEVNSYKSEKHFYLRWLRE
jgi:hypothetical protein